MVDTTASVVFTMLAAVLNLVRPGKCAPPPRSVGGGGGGNDDDDDDDWVVGGFAFVGDDTGDRG